MAAAMLCGDEIASAVVDIGGAYCKFGSAGQDMPPHVFRSDVGLTEQSGQEKTFTLGDSALRVVSDSIEVVNPFSSEGFPEYYLAHALTCATYTYRLYMY